MHWDFAPQKKKDKTNEATKESILLFPAKMAAPFQMCALPK